jgi:hypothetical protein
MKHRLAIVAAVLLTLAPARAQDRLSDAREHFDKGVAAFALGHYADAADEYEKAFQLKTDPALLYNAAQAHRLAGHYERALELYQSFDRIFGKRTKSAPKVQKHIDELTRLLASRSREPERPPVAATPPSPAPQESATTRATPSPSLPEPPRPSVAAPQPSNARPELVHAHDAPRSRVKRTWLWIGVGGAVVAVGLGVGLGVGLSRAPTPTFGATTVMP